MKKRLISLLAAMTMLVSLAACGGGNSGNGGKPNSEPTTENPSSESKGGEITDCITVQPLKLEGLNEKYLPVSSEIKQRSGQIDVVIQFESTEPAWEALAAEYQRLHSDAVTVNIGMEGVQGKYKDRLNTELNNPKTDWDIVQGNLVSDLSAKCYNMAGAINKVNGYAGNLKWSSVLNRNAYTTDTTGSTSSVYIINSQDLQTAWFINTVAFEAAKTEATKEGATIKQTPETWDELMEVCKYMKKAGYNYPLGISLDNDSVDGFQFSWLIRVYGDYYYRNEYKNIMTSDNFELDVTDENPESDPEYGANITKFYNVVLDDTSEYYCGAKSPKYKEFVSQFAKMREYVHVTAATDSFETVRNKFKTQSGGKNSPQIMLDYAGSGLSFNDVDGFSMDFFDYPRMVSEGGYIDDGTIMRDVGGNGGYLSVLNHDTKQNELNLDFIKFVMSPYGQSIYYNALSKTDVAPQGITTVKNDLVVVPQKWIDFFKTDKISFTGLSDSNDFVKSFLRYIAMNKDNIETSIKIWRGLLKTDAPMSIDEFSTTWHNSLMVAWKEYATSQKWNEDCYKVWGGPTNG